MRKYEACGLNWTLLRGAEAAQKVSRIWADLAREVRDNPDAAHFATYYQRKARKAARRARATMNLVSR